jgi:hypothetical protein
MSQQNDREYLEQRLRLSKQKARNATDPGIARIHDQFAAAYAQRLEQQAAPPAE